jgi:DNA-binding response OmpR family regulator
MMPMAHPTILVTARSRDSIPPDLLQQGSVKCLFKPSSGADLSAALDAALRNLIQEGMFAERVGGGNKYGYADKLWCNVKIVLHGGS